MVLAYFHVIRMALRNILDFSDDELEYYSRQIVLRDFGLKGQRKLKGSRVCVVGVGGLGSPVCIQLASMGVGYLRLIDRDVVEMSNLQRQHIYGIDKLGYPKVEAASERLKNLNPFIEIDPVPMSLRPGNAENLIMGVDLVIDCLDSMSARYALNRACAKQGIPLVYGAVIMNVGNCTSIIPGETPCLECFQGNIDDSNLPSCATNGVHPSIISIIASIQVSEAIRILLGLDPNLAGQLLFCDLGDLSFERIGIRRVDTCPVCGTKPEPKELITPVLQEICGRDSKRVFVFTPDEDLDVNLESVNSYLLESGYNLLVKGKLGTTFMGENVKASTLKSGVIILEGPQNMQEAMTIINALRNVF